MNGASSEDLGQALAEVPMADVHTHLSQDRLGARGLADVALYHMVISDLYAAGCPDGQRVLEPHDPAVAARRLERAAPFFARTANTSNAWMLRAILRDLYDWDEPITSANWERLDGIIRERSSDTGWAASVLRKANVTASTTEYARRGSGPTPVPLHYSLEWGMFTRATWGHPDAPVYELERCWGFEPTPPLEIGPSQWPPAERPIRSAADAIDAVDWYVKAMPDNLMCMGTHFSTRFNYAGTTSAEFEAALRNRSAPSVSEQGIFASFINDAFLESLERNRPDVAVMFSAGAEPLPYETGSELNQATVGQLGEMMARHSGLRFVCLLGSAHSNQAVCTLAREIPNLAVGGYWWHNFYPSVMQGILEQRLDMLPIPRHIGFFSDAYTVEWVYAKALMVRRIAERVLAGRVRDGWYTFEDAVAIARTTWQQTAADFLRMKVVG